MTEFEANLRRLRGELHDLAVRAKRAEADATILEQTLMQLIPGFSRPAAPLGGTFAPCGIPIAATIYMHDAVHGSSSMAWNGTLWTSCRTLTCPTGTGSGSCNSGVPGVAYHFELLTTSTFRVRYKGVVLTSCPVAGACSDATNVTAQHSPGFITVDSCTPFTGHATVGNGGGFQMVYGAAAFAGVTVTFADTPI